MKQLIRTVICAVTLFLGATGAANATIIVTPGSAGSANGTSGLQTFNFILPFDFAGDVTIGSSNEGDTLFNGLLELSNFSAIFGAVGPFSLQGTSDDTSGFSNAQGDPGTNGELLVLPISGLGGDEVSFDWQYTSFDNSGFQDFAFVQGGALYWVLAQNGGEVIDPSPVPAPASIALLALGLLAARIASRRRT